MCSVCIKNIKKVNCVFRCCGGMITPPFVKYKGEIISFEDFVKQEVKHQDDKNYLASAELVNFVENCYKKGHKNIIIQLIDKNYSIWGVDTYKDWCCETFKNGDKFCYIPISYSDYIFYRGQGQYVLKNNCLYW